MIAWNICIYKNSIPFLVHLLSPPAVPFSTPQQKGRVLILEITGMRHSIVEWLLGETVKKRNRSTHDLLYMFSPPTRSLDQVAGRLPRESFVPYSHHDHQLQTTTTTEVTAMKSIGGDWNGITVEFNRFTSSLYPFQRPDWVTFDSTMFLLLLLLSILMIAMSDDYFTLS